MILSSPILHINRQHIPIGASETHVLWPAWPPIVELIHLVLDPESVQWISDGAESAGQPLQSHRSLQPEIKGTKCYENGTRHSVRDDDDGAGKGELLPVVVLVTCYFGYFQAASNSRHNHHHRSSPSFTIPLPLDPVGSRGQSGHQIKRYYYYRRVVC